MILATLALFAVTATPPRVLACDLTALTSEQRTRHRAMTKRLLEHATMKELPDGFAFSIDRARIPVPDLAEWVADEARCCPGVDFQLELPAFGPLTLRLVGGEDVKKFIRAEISPR